MTNIRSVIRSGFLATMIVPAATVGAMNTSDALENIASVMAAREVCGFNVNRHILQIAIEATFGSVESVSPGGRHWPEMQSNMARIQSVTNSESGRLSFCSRVRSQLSAFFD